jgi:hypothetical protein
MARQEDICWSCGADWITTDEHRSALRAVPGGAFAHRQDARQPRNPQTVLGNARATTQTRHDSDRWVDEGGSVAAEAPAAAG